MKTNLKSVPIAAIAQSAISNIWALGVGIAILKNGVYVPAIK